MANNHSQFRETEIGLIPEDWEILELGDLVEIKHGFAFSGKYFSDVPTNNILLTPGNFNIGGGFNDSKLKYYDGEVPDNYVLNCNDLIVTMTDLSKDGDTLGYPALVPDSQNSHYLHNQRIGLVQILSNKVNNGYLYWLLRSRPYRQFILGSATGTTVKHTAPERIKKYEFALPPLIEQEKIAEVLGALDEKIELNRKMNKTLESIGQAIFKNWFLDLRKEDKTRLIKLGELIESQESGDWGKDEKSGNFSSKVLCIRGTDIPEIAFGAYAKPPIRYIKSQNIALKSLRPHDIVVEISGGSSNQQTGRSSLISRELLQRYELPLICSNFCRILRPRTHYSSFFINYLRYLYRGDELYQFENGTTGIKNLNLDNLLRVEIAMPFDEKIFQRFDEFYLSLYKQIQENGSQISLLSQIRDSLLPRLMSGKLRIK